jgi:hypothetical protein
VFVSCWAGFLLSATLAIPSVFLIFIPRASVVAFALLLALRRTGLKDVKRAIAAEVGLLEMQLTSTDR